ncbi:hypothetical protein KP509_22G080100 [Ceratopteris richardii]|uniref:C2 domain-containing protein n=1 Tax=Ceratopteris richardii TaxID=49495 RepID=A0A8T2SA05_CERRI|nr:hypothetical protein KP509_22G080100 [Ceratopteris richardii]
MESTMVYAGAVIFMLLWLVSALGFSSFWLYTMAFLFLFQVDRNRKKNLRREICTEERRHASQKQLGFDIESVNWINQAVERIWPLFLEKSIAEEILKPILPWFLDRHKPWTIRAAAIRELELGKDPPRFRGFRVLKDTLGDDDLVIESWLDYRTGEDMHTILSMQIRRRVGLGIKSKIHISKIQIEGKVRMGLKFTKSWPFLSRVGICFQNSPFVQMTARPLSHRGINVSELPLIAGWMERIVADAFEQSLVEPKVLVLDIEKLLQCTNTLDSLDASEQDYWFSVQEMAPIATLHLKILEATDLKPSHSNGLADVFVRGSFGTSRFKTSIQRKSLHAKWFEEFEIPIASWELPTFLILHVLDKDRFSNADLGYCEIDIAKFRNSKTNDFWITLQNSKSGRLRIALTITEDVSRIAPLSFKREVRDVDGWDDKMLMAEGLELINLGKENDGCLCLVSPGHQPLRRKSWQERHGVQRRASTIYQKQIKESIHQDALASSSSEGDYSPAEKTKTRRRKRVFLRKWTQSAFAGGFNKNGKKYDEYIAVGRKGTTVRMKVEEESKLVGVDDLSDDEQDTAIAYTNPSRRDHMKSMAKGLVKHVEKAAQNVSLALTSKRLRKSAPEDDDMSSEASSSISTNQLEFSLGTASEVGVTEGEDHAWVSWNGLNTCNERHCTSQCSQETDCSLDACKFLQPESPSVTANKNPCFGTESIGRGAVGTEEKLCVIDSRGSNDDKERIEVPEEFSQEQLHDMMDRLPKQVEEDAHDLHSPLDRNEITDIKANTMM